jgi:UDP-glucuronate 4-epimerase
MTDPTLAGPLRCLVTGAAGFIGAHLCQRLLDDGHHVVGLDNYNDYYDVQLKRDRTARLAGRDRFRMVEMDLKDREVVEALFAGGGFDVVVHLAAQAGVRYSISNPHVYAVSNVVGFMNVLEGCRHGNVRHLVYASSSSVYGANTRMPFSERDNVDHPVSLYAASKKANELMAHSYSHLYGLPTTGLRFFTVYGPWGRPDMAYFKFTRAILAGEPIHVYNEGQMARDFTFVDDIVEGVAATMVRPPAGDPAWSGDAPDPSASRAPYRVYNIGNHTPVRLLDFIGTLEEALGTEATKNLLPMQPGDVVETFADVSALERDTGFRPTTPLDEGLRQFVAWYREYYAVAPVAAKTGGRAVA